MSEEPTAAEQNDINIYVTKVQDADEAALLRGHQNLDEALERTLANGGAKLPGKHTLPVLEGKLRVCEAQMTSRGITFVPSIHLQVEEGGISMPRSTKHDIWSLVETVLSHSPRSILYGPPGTGKTHSALKKGLRTAQQAIHTVTLTEESVASDMRGTFLPKGQEFVWHDGPAIRALRHGDRLVINEVDHASPDVWSFLLAMLDDFDMIAETLPSGETIKAKQGYHVVATMNGKPEDLPEALADRFTVRLPIDKPNPEAFLALPEHLRQVAEATSTKTDKQRIGLRSWITFAELQGSIDNEAAARAVFGDRWEAVLDSLDAKASA